MKVNQQNEGCFPKDEKSKTKLNFLHLVSLQPYGYLSHSKGISLKRHNTLKILSLRHYLDKILRGADLGKSLSLPCMGIITHKNIRKSK